MFLFEDLKPFLRMAGIFGLAPYSVNNHDILLSRKGIIYSIFCTIIYGYLFYIRLDSSTITEDDAKLRFLTISRTVLSECVIFVDIFVSIIWHGKLQATFACIERYDNVAKLETRTGLNSARTWIGFSAIAIYFLMLGWLTYLYEAKRPIESSLLYVILYASTTFGILKFSAIVASLLHRFRHLNRILKVSGNNEDQPVIGWSRRQLNLRDAWSLHGCLIAAAEKLNSFYTAQLLLWIAALTFNIISRIYVFCGSDGFSNLSRALREGSLAVIFISLLTILAWICHMTAAEANKVGPTTFSPDSSVFRRRHNDKFDESTQIGLYFLFHRFNFSAASGFIQVDLPLLQTIAGTMTTYLVILKAPG